MVPRQALSLPPDVDRHERPELADVGTMELVVAQQSAA